MVVVRGYDAARAVLADPRFEVPALPDGDADEGIAWLRASVSRFCTGETHQRRRRLVTELLGGVESARLGERARQLAATMPADAVAVAVLAPVVGVDVEIALDTVPAIASAYQPTSTADPRPASAAVRRLVLALGPGEDELLAARIAVLVQAYQASADLIAAALRRHGSVAEAVVLDPPAPLARRTAREDVVDADLTVRRGELVEVDVASANRDPDRDGEPLTFGAGIRPCPGRAHALAIVAAVVEVLS